MLISVKIKTVFAEGDMSLDTFPVIKLSNQQRRCRALLMLFSPMSAVQLETISRFNGVAPTVSRQDIAQISDEINQLYHLDICIQANNFCQIEGKLLDKRLCLIDCLRRGLRYCPEFIDNYFSVDLYRALALELHQVNNWLKPQLQKIMECCEKLLAQPFSERDRRFLPIYIFYCAWENQQQRSLHLKTNQRDWLNKKRERAAANILFHSINPLLPTPLATIERDMIILMLTMLKTHNYSNSNSVEDIRLMNSVHNMICRFQRFSEVSFSNKTALASQLYSHLAPAIARCYFNIGVDNLLLDRITSKYPRLLRTTQQALVDFEREYQIEFSSEEIGLIAISFGAWLMQSNALQEKQVLLLTRDNSQLEEELERQIRELTILPLHIKYYPLDKYLQCDTPPDDALVITPYFVLSPPLTSSLIQALLPLTKQQSEQIRMLLEAPQHPTSNSLGVGA
ncbi:transcriptional antiterminator [Candidatus Regiella insecticola LSR1]|uniref:Transcriptional antiterminator n=2 Tax=Candidatus Regiella insecticola TaxID=138073 RepID=E0WUC5_9ENTR|nr:transcriptional antiterminator [Candidatus Regiella insecticola LSR1]